MMGFMKWFYLENGAQRGPITEAEFPALFQTGVIGAQTYIWREGMPEWKTYGEVLGQPNPGSGGGNVEPAVGKTALRTVATATESGVETESAVACTQCGTEVPASQIMRIGSAAMCPKCQTAYQRQARTAYSDAPLEYANPVQRLAAFILDQIICFVVVFALALALELFGPRLLSDPGVRRAVSIGVYLCLVFWVLDYFIGRIARDGATPAMKLFRIRVARRNGDKVGGLRALGRFLLIGLINSVTLCLGHLVAFFDKERRSLHEIVCGTVVVKKEK